MKVGCVDPKTSLGKEEFASIYLPHLMFSHLGNHYPTFFKEEFGLGKGKLQKFWRGVQQVEDDRLESHPMSLEKDWEERCIPLFLHGDGGIPFHRHLACVLLGHHDGPEWWVAQEGIGCWHATPNHVLGRVLGHQCGSGLNGHLKPLEKGFIL